MPVPIIAPDGTLGDIDESEVQRALAQGYRLPTPEDERAKQYDAPVVAGVLGAARGLSLGASDVFLGASGLGSRETVRGLEEANPKASTGAEIGATLATALIPGAGEAELATAPGMLARLGRTTEGAVARGLGEGAEKLAGKALAKAASGAVEGSAYGAAAEVNREYLEDRDFSAEKILAAGGLNALFGGGLGGVLSGAGGVAKKVLRRSTAEAKYLPALEANAEKVRAETGDVGAKAAPAAEQAAGPVSGAAPTTSPSTAPGARSVPGFDPDAFVEEGLTNPVGAAARARKELEESTTKHAPVIKRAFEALGIDFPTPENLVLRDLDIQRTAKQRLRDKGLDEFAPRALLDDPAYKKVTSLSDKVKLIEAKRLEAGEAIGNSVSKFDELAQPGEHFNYPDVARKIREEVIAPLKTGTTLNDGLIARLEKEADALEYRPEITFKDAEALKRSYDPHLKWNNMETTDAGKKAFRQIRGIINSEIENKAGAIAKRVGKEELLTDWKRAKTMFGAMSELGEMAEKRLSAREQNRFFSLTDNLWGTGAMAFGGPLGIPVSLGMMIVNKWGRERMPQVLALAIDAVDKNKAIGRAAIRLQEAVKEAPEGAFGQFDEALRAAAKQGPKEAVAAHVALSQTAGEAYDTVAKANKLDSFTEAVATNGASQEVWERIQGAVKSLGATRIGTTATAAIGANVLAKPLMARDGKEPTDRREQLARRLDELAALTTDPELLTNQVAAGLSGADPEVREALSARAANAIAFLQSKAPKRPADNSPFPALQRPWRPSDEEVAKFERYMRAVNDPLSVLDNLKQGRVTREAVEALQAVYPKLYEDVRGAVAERLGDAKTKIGYNQRISLGVLFGAPVDPSLEPGMFQLLQAAHQQTRGTGPSGPPSGKQYHPDRGLASMTERLAGRS